MSRKTLCAACGLALVVAAAGSSASMAQGVRRFQPSRPTVSPYMNLFRNNTGPLPNYYSLVRPQIQQEAFNAQQVAQQAQQNSALKMLQSQTAPPLTPTGKSSGFMTFGRAGFMTHGGGGGRR